jgi:hypothetical protein
MIELMNFGIRASSLTCPLSLTFLACLPRQYPRLDPCLGACGSPCERPLERPRHCRHVAALLPVRVPLGSRRDAQLSHHTHCMRLAGDDRSDPLFVSILEGNRAGVVLCAL